MRAPSRRSGFPPAPGPSMPPAGRRRRWGHLAGLLEPTERLALGGMAVVIAGLFIAGLALLLVAATRHLRISHTETLGVGTGMLALTLGMRHAFDADHISAIDNTTRKLMGEDQRPLGVGFFFSLGHSTVVFVMAVLLGLGVRAFDQQVSDSGSSLHQVAAVVGTSVSGGFLYLIGALNAIVLVSVVRAFLALRRGDYDEQELERRLAQRGFMNRFFGRLAGKIDRSWKMYPIGVLFGLGFDTASEVALLVLSGTVVASGLPFWAVLSLPLLFAAGMSLFDTLDGCFMNFAYGWAFSRPVRKIYYNVVVTGLSVAVAFFIGSVELLDLLTTELGLHGGLWSTIGRFDVNRAGFAVVGLFVVTWVAALAVWRLGRIEARWERRTRPAPVSSSLDQDEGEPVVALAAHRLDLGRHDPAFAGHPLVEPAGGED